MSASSGQVQQCSGDLFVQGGLRVLGPTVIPALNVLGATHLQGSLTVAGATELAGDTHLIGSLLTVAGAAEFAGATHLQGSLTVVGATNLQDNLTVLGNARIDGVLLGDNTVGNGDVTVGAGLNVAAQLASFLSCQPSITGPTDIVVGVAGGTVKVPTSFVNGFVFTAPNPSVPELLGGSITATSIVRPCGAQGYGNAVIAPTLTTGNPACNVVLPPNVFAGYIKFSGNGSQAGFVTINITGPHLFGNSVLILTPMSYQPNQNINGEYDTLFYSGLGPAGIAVDPITQNATFTYDSKLALPPILSVIPLVYGPSIYYWTFQIL